MRILQAHQLCDVVGGLKEDSTSYDTTEQENEVTTSTAGTNSTPPSTTPDYRSGSSAYERWEENQRTKLG